MSRNGFVLPNKNIITNFGAVRGLRERHKTESSPIICAKAEKVTGLSVLRSGVTLSQSTGVCVRGGVQSETAECLHSTAAKQTEISSN